MSQETGKVIKEDARKDWAIAAARADATESLKKERKYLDSDKGIEMLEDLALKLVTKYQVYGLEEEEATKIVRQAAAHVSRFRRDTDKEGIVGTAKQHAQASGMNQASQELFGGTGVATAMSVLGKPIRSLAGTGEYAKDKSFRSYRDSVQMPTFTQFFTEDLKSELLLLRALEYIDRVKQELTHKAEIDKPPMTHTVSQPFKRDGHTDFSNKLGGFVTK